MGVLRDLTLKRTSISEICMADGVYPWLQTIDLSENIQLKQVIALPSALVRLNLQDCRVLDTLENLSSLVNLKFLNINGCIALETLSVRGLICVEEIEADGCWKLKRIEGMDSLKRLNCLKISTDNKIFWEDVRKFLKSQSSNGLSNFMWTGKVDDQMDEGQIRRKMFEPQFPIEIFELRFQNVSNITSSQDSNQRCWILERRIDTRIQGCIFCFFTNDVGGCSFHVEFVGILRISSKQWREYKLPSTTQSNF